MTDLPCDTELPTSHPLYASALRRTPTEAPAVADVEHLSDPHLATDCPECGNGKLCSPALCNRRRELHARLAESVRMLDGASNVVELAQERAARAERRRPLVRGWR